jgi:hypothetical protein
MRNKIVLFIAFNMFFITAFANDNNAKQVPKSQQLSDIDMQLLQLKIEAYKTCMKDGDGSPNYCVDNVNKLFEKEEKPNDK